MLEKRVDYLISKVSMINSETKSLLDELLTMKLFLELDKDADKKDVLDKGEAVRRDRTDSGGTSTVGEREQSEMPLPTD